MRLKKRHYDEKTQSCIGDNHNSTFTRHNDLTALERQCLWPSCRIPISRVYATVEMKREQGLYRAPGLSDYCLKTRVFWPWQRVDRHRGSARSQLFSPFFQAEDFWRAHLCVPPCLFTFQTYCKFITGQGTTMLSILRVCGHFLINFSPTVLK